MPILTPSRRYAFLFPILIGIGLWQTATAAPDCASTDINFDQTRLMGQPENLCQTYAGKVLLVVNVASHCGFTPQYEGLEGLYQRFRDQGLVVLGFPSSDFGGQEFADEQSIQKFCKLNFGVSFPMFGKRAVLGDHANPLFVTLARRTGKIPAWNFNKYLIGRDGKVLAYFPSQVTPDAPRLLDAIKAELNK